MFPQEIVNKILEYDGRIKYRNGKYMDQLSILDDKYNKIVKLINKKSMIYENYNYPSYIHFLLKKENGIHIGIIFDMDDYYTDYFIISFYKDQSRNFWYNLTDIFYKYFRIHHPFLFITNYYYG